MDYGSIFHGRSVAMFRKLSSGPTRFCVLQERFDYRLLAPRLGQDLDPRFLKLDFFARRGDVMVVVVLRLSFIIFFPFSREEKRQAKGWKQKSDVL